MNRRDLLAMGAGTVLATAAGRLPAAVTGGGLRWGAQLFTVMLELERDFPGTLRRLAQMGYREVETVGSMGQDPAALREMLDRFGLISPSQHLAPPEIYRSFVDWARKDISTEVHLENFVQRFTINNAPALIDQGIRSARILGQQYIVWQILLPHQLASAKVVDAHIDMFNKAGRQCRDAGLRFAYHAHARELTPVDGIVPFDRIAAGTDPALVSLELDFYWFHKAGIDPLSYLNRMPGRFRMGHIKDMTRNGDFAAAGDGILPLQCEIAAARSAGMTHFFVEIDRADDAMQAMRRSIDHLAAHETRGRAVDRSSCRDAAPRR